MRFENQIPSQVQVKSDAPWILSDTIAWTLPQGFVAAEKQAAAIAAAAESANQSSVPWADKDRAHVLKMHVQQMEGPLFKACIYATARGAITLSLLAKDGVKIEWIDCGRKKTYRFRYAREWTYRYEPENAKVVLRWNGILDFAFEPGAPFLGALPEMGVKLVHFDSVEVSIMREMLPPRFRSEEKDKRFDREPGSPELSPLAKETVETEADDEEDADIHQQIVE